MAPPLQDLRRIALGFFLVAEEALSHSPAFRAVKSSLLSANRPHRHLQGQGSPIILAPEQRIPRLLRRPDADRCHRFGAGGCGGRLRGSVRSGVREGGMEVSMSRRPRGGSRERRASRPLLSPGILGLQVSGLAWGTIQESAKRMRGAALKLGQMLSIQAESLVPALILYALEIARQGADIIPWCQLNEVLKAELGSDWTSKLQSFDYEPMAAASIGQTDPNWGNFLDDTDTNL